MKKQDVFRGPSTLFADFKFSWKFKIDSCHIVREFQHFSTMLVFCLLCTQHRVQEPQKIVSLSLFKFALIGKGFVFHIFGTARMASSSADILRNGRLLQTGLEKTFEIFL